MSDQPRGSEAKETMEDRRARAHELRRQGKSVRAIAAIMGVSKSTVARLCEGVNAPTTPADHRDGVSLKVRTHGRRKRDESAWWGPLAGLAIVAAACVVPFFFRLPPGYGGPPIEPLQGG